MPDRLSNLSSLAPHITSFILMALLALWGYIADFSYRALRGEAKQPYWKSFLLDAPGAVFFGVMTYFLGQAASLDGWTLAALVGLAGHVGGRGIYQLEKTLIDRVLKKVSKDD